MGFFRRFAPLRAFRDLRQYLHGRPPYELLFLGVAIAVTCGVIAAFSYDNSHVDPPYVPPKVLYVEQWRADRTDDQIKAQQVIDEAAKQKRLAAEKAQEEKTRAQFRKIDNALTKWGI